MGDVWPCRGPWYVTWDQAAQAAANAGFTRSESFVMAAIGAAESSLDLSVINDTPSTGDYSVGAWQINYYNGLYAGRTQLFGTPCQLINSGLSGQARAAYAIWRFQGFSAWSTYTSGAYEKYLNGFTGGGKNLPQGNISGDIPPPPGPGADDYSRHILRTAGLIDVIGKNTLNAYNNIRRVRTHG